MLPTGILVSLLTFFGLNLIPGDIALINANIGGGQLVQGQLVDQPGAGESAGGEINSLDAFVEAFNVKFGLDQPVGIRYLKWVRGMLTGDPGKSMATEKPIWRDVKVRAPVTLHILFFSLIFSMFFGVTAGLLAAVFQDSWLDYFVRVFAVFADSFPSFFLLTLLILLPAIWWQYAAPVGYDGPIWEDPWRGVKQYIPPAFLLSLGASFTVRITRSSLLEVLRSDFVRTARSKGLNERTVILRHAMRNSMIPVVTIFGGTFGFLLGGNIILEQVMALPGLGQYTFNAVISRDINVVQAMTMYAAFTVMTVNLLVDLSYAFLDPRIRYQ